MRFEEFAAARLPAVLRFAGVLTGDRALAEDVVQEVLIRASKGWDRIGQLRWLAVTATAAAALAGTVTALTLPGASTGGIPNGGVSSSGSASAATLRAKVLAAFSAASGDFVYVSSATVNSSGSPIVTQTWAYPSQASPGQLVRSRNLTFNPSGTERDDFEATFVEPEGGDSRTPGQAVVTAKVLDVNYVSKTWTDQNVSIAVGTSRGESAVIAEYIESEQWTVRRTTLNGRAALEFSFKVAGNSDSPTSHLWVDAGTYLPLRETNFFGPPGTVTSDTLNFEYLPATPANLAKLTPPIPAGFKQVRSTSK